MNRGLPRLQEALAGSGCDGWLFYYFLGNDPIAARLLSLEGKHLTRRVFYFVPRRGVPAKLLHRIEPDALDHLPGRAVYFSSWHELREGLAAVFGRARRVAMQYSPDVPYVSRVDAGTVELVRSLGVRVLSSGDLVQAVESVLSPAQWARHRRTAAALRRIVLDAFGFARTKIRRGARLTEFDVQRRILAGYRRHGLVSGADPIVAVNANSARPHYAPSAKKHRPVRRGDWLLLDIWAKPRGADAVYADITWCGFAGESVPGRFEDVFGIVREARDKAFRFVKREVAAGRRPEGRRVDETARKHIRRQGYGEFFIHRTGHSIGTEDHGNGANMDNHETRETRRVLPGALFSIEPGIYLKDFGARSEIDVYIDGRRAVATGGPVQARVLPILKDKFPAECFTALT